MGGLRIACLPPKGEGKQQVEDLLILKGEGKQHVEDLLTFIDIITDKTNTDIVVSDAKGDQEARDDLRVGLGSVQKRDHVVARIAGSGDKPPTSAPRDSMKEITQ